MHSTFPPSTQAHSWNPESDDSATSTTANPATTLTKPAPAVIARNAAHAHRRGPIPPEVRDLIGARTAGQPGTGQATAQPAEPAGAARACVEALPGSSAAHLARLGIEEPFPEVSALRRRADNFSAMIDVLSAIRQFNNAGLLAQLRQPVLRDAAGQPSVSLAQLHLQLSDFQQVLRAAPAVRKEDQAGLKQIEKLLADALKNVHNLLHGSKGSQRVVHALASLVLYLLPALTAYFQHQEQYLIMVCAAYAKTAALAIGYVRNETGDLKLFTHHLKSRHSVFLYPALAYTIPAFVKAANHLQHNIPYGIGAAILNAGALMATFYSKEVTALYQRMTGTQDDGGRLPQEMHVEARNLIAAMQENQTGMTQLRGHFEKSVGPISDHLSTTLSFHHEGMTALETEIKKRLKITAAENHPAGADQVGPSHLAQWLAQAMHRKSLDPAAPKAAKDPDLTHKLAFAATAIIVTTALVALNFPDLMPVIDLGEDAILVACIMVMLALNKAKTKQDALYELVSFAGLSMISVAFSSANKATGYLEKDAGFVPGLLGITASNLLLARPLASALANVLLILADGAGSAANYVRTATAGPAPDVDLEMGPGPRIVELPDDDADTAASSGLRHPPLPPIDAGSTLSEDIGRALGIDLGAHAAPGNLAGQARPA